MTKDRALIAAHPAGEQPIVERGKAKPVVADTFAGQVHIEWEAGEGAAVTPLGQLPFFIEYILSITSVRLIREEIQLVALDVVAGFGVVPDKCLVYRHFF